MILSLLALSLDPGIKCPQLTQEWGDLDLFKKVWTLIWYNYMHFFKKNGSVELSLLILFLLTQLTWLLFHYFISSLGILQATDSLFLHLGSLGINKTKSFYESLEYAVNLNCFNFLSFLKESKQIFMLPIVFPKKVEDSHLIRC